MFIRSFSNEQIERMQSGERGELFALLKEDVLKGTVFPAIRKGELHFYYRGGCLYKFSGGSFKRDKNFAKYCDGSDGLSTYERAKRENEIRYKNSSGGSGERQLLDGLYGYTFTPQKRSDVVVLDIEVNLGGQAVRKCDLVLLNTKTDEIAFVEAKVFTDKRVKVALSYIPEVIGQVKSYTSAFLSQTQNILEQYSRHIRVLNGLFGTEYLPPRKVVQPAKLIVFETPEGLNLNGAHSVDIINEQLGAGNVLWVKSGENPSLDSIWHSLVHD